MEVTIGGATRIMGMIGDPIAQARTPGAINPIFAAKGADIACVPLHVPKAALAKVWSGLRAIPNLVGFGVTLPHKQLALELCDSLDPLAARVGAVNVVRREADGHLRGYQFDGAGFVRGLRTAGIAIEGRRCLLIGAGGAAVAIAYALAGAGVEEIVVVNRTRDKAEALADKLNSDLGRTNLSRAGDPLPAPGQLVINATSLGLNYGDPLPLDPAILHPSMTVAEVIAQPEVTPLLYAAQARGLEVHSGLRMIEGQVGAIADHICELWG